MFIDKKNVTIIVMKRFLPLACGALAILLFSCSNPQSSVLTQQENTLRAAVQLKNAATVWTNEIEPERLTARLNNSIEVSDTNFVTPQFLQSIDNLQQPVYPQIIDFAGLDCSKMNAVLYKTMKEFSDSLCKDTENLQDYFHSDYFYNYIFFKNDLKDAVSFDKNEKTLFDRYLICTSFEAEDIIQVPVRFYRKKEFVDLSVYLIYHNSYKITNIEILRWGKLNGEAEE